MSVALHLTSFFLFYFFVFNILPSIKMNPFLNLLFRRLRLLIFSPTLFSISNLINFDDNIFLNIIISLSLTRHIQLTGVGRTAYRSQWLYVPFILPMMRAVTSLMISLVIMTFLAHNFFSIFQ